MKVISKAINKNNSRATIRFSENGILTKATEIAKKHGCGFSHNVTTVPIADEKEVKFKESRGTISFNKGAHSEALAEFINTVK